MSDEEWRTAAVLHYLGFSPEIETTRRTLDAWNDAEKKIRQDQQDSGKDSDYELLKMAQGLAETSNQNNAQQQTRSAPAFRVYTK